jgi:hypothetical protein
MSTEYYTTKDKERLLLETINNICNNLHIPNLSRDVNSKNIFFKRSAFTEFKTIIKKAEVQMNVELQKELAREAIDLWDFQVIFQPLAKYVELLKQILQLFRDFSTVDLVWIKNEKTCVLQTRSPDSSDDVESIESVPIAPIRSVTAPSAPRRKWLESGVESVPAPRVPTERKPGVESVPAPRPPTERKSGGESVPAPRPPTARKPAEVASDKITDDLRKLRELLDKIYSEAADQTINEAPATRDL